MKCFLFSKWKHLLLQTPVKIKQRSKLSQVFSTSYNFFLISNTKRKIKYYIRWFGCNNFKSTANYYNKINNGNDNNMNRILVPLVPIII